MARAPWGSWMLLMPSDEAGQQRAKFLESAVLMPVVSEQKGLERIPDLVVPQAVEVAGQADVGVQSKALRRMVDADFVFADITGCQPELMYYIGARDLLADRRLTLVFHFGEVPLGLEDIFGARLIKGSEGDPAAAAAKLRDALTKGMPADDDAMGSLLRKRLRPVQVNLGARAIDAETKRQPPRMWRVQAGQEIAPTRLGIWCGELKDIDKRRHGLIHAVINSENTYLEMARIHDRGLSGSIRYLGSNWSNNDQDCDDLIYRELIAKSGVRRPVQAGTVIITSAGRMIEKYGVEVIAHVASVEPPHAGDGKPIAGRGYVPVDDLELCVRNVLAKLDVYYGGVRALTGGGPRTVLFPLFGTGNAQGDARVISRRLVSEAVKYVREHPRSRLGRILFLAYSNIDLELCTDALDSAEGVEPET